jgi:hypothetical protein
MGDVKILKLDALIDSGSPICIIKATSNRTYYHKVQDHSLSISNPA